jgi:hypothetical protein
MEVTTTQQNVCITALFSVVQDVASLLWGCVRAARCAAPTPIGEERAVATTHEGKKEDGRSIHRLSGTLSQVLSPAAPGGW